MIWMHKMFFCDWSLRVFFCSHHLYRGGASYSKPLFLSADGAREKTSTFCQNLSKWRAGGHLGHVSRDLSLTDLSPLGICAPFSCMGYHHMIRNIFCIGCHNMVRNIFCMGCHNMVRNIFCMGYHNMVRNTLRMGDHNMVRNTFRMGYHNMVRIIFA